MLLQSHDGAVHILPALPDHWPTGKITGLAARGGFKVDITWKDKVITEVRIASGLGGNCRLRIANELVHKIPSNLSPAKGAQTNPFYEVPQVKMPIISTEAKLPRAQIPPAKEYDLMTQAGKVYVLKFNSL
jgi:alpha-L-fucosidase 2